MDPIQKNLAETLAEVLPKAAILGAVETGVPNLFITHVAVPKGTDIKELKTDLEALLPNPRRTTATATFADATSFLAYVARHATDGSVVWCNFNPQTFSLGFTAVIDEHAKGVAGWRSHRAAFTPDMSAEWKAWKSKDATSMPQVVFAEWLQEHAEDIASKEGDGLPTSLALLTMATNFVATEERQFKSVVKLQSGGVRMTYIADPDAGTTETMDAFDKFGIAIPVFHGSQVADRINARLKYRQANAKVSFHYELVRPDKVHKSAAEDLIAIIRDGLGGVPMLMGACA